MYSSYYRSIKREQASVKERGGGESVFLCVCLSVCHTDITAAVLSGFIQNTHTWLTSDSGSHQTLAPSGKLYSQLLGSLQLPAPCKSKTGQDWMCIFNIHAGRELYCRSLTGTGPICSCTLNITSTPLLGATFFA